MSIFMTTTRHASLSTLGSLLLMLSACPEDDGEQTETETEDGTGDTAEPPFDQDEVIESAKLYATDLVKINAEARPSQHGAASTVNFYVEQEMADLYRMLDPEAPAPVALPEGTLVVKEHLNDEGAPNGFTMMYKGPAGYDSDASDWFWARVDGSGATQETGAVPFCIDCHSAAGASGHIFGVPLDNRL